MTSPIMPEGNPAPEALSLLIIRHLRSRGHQAYLVGGGVRDRILGYPAKDFDVSTDATPTQLIQYFPGAQLVGAHFGVVVVHSGGGHVEVATFRSEGPYSDGRRPDAVRFERDPRADALRRDFTINALFADPLNGEILDFVGGQQDCAAGIIRAIGDPEQRFEEDHLRMLRAVRFAARLHFTIEPRTLEAIVTHAKRIHAVSMERIAGELTRILTEGGATRGLQLLKSTGLLEQLLPEVRALEGVEQPPEYHPEGDVWQHVLLMLEKMQSPTPTLAWSVLLHDIGKPATFFRAPDRIRFDGHAEAGVEIAARILGRLRFSNDEKERVLALVGQHMRFKDVLQMRTSTLVRFLRLPHFDEHLELHRLDVEASNGNFGAYEYAKASLAGLRAEELRPPRLIGGRDLLNAGFAPGPRFSEVLEAVETAQLEGEVATADEAMALARRLLSSIP